LTKEDIVEKIKSAFWTVNYDDYVPKKLDLLIDTIPSVFRRIAEEERDRVFLIFFNRKYTYTRR